MTRYFHGAQMITNVKGHQHRWLAGDYDLETDYFSEVAAMLVTWWIMDFGTSVFYLIDTVHNLQ